MQEFFLSLFYKDSQAIKFFLKKAICKPFNHKLSTFIHMCQEQEISGIIATITAFLLNFWFVETFLMGDFDMGMENNLNDNVFCKYASLPQVHPWKIPHSNSSVLSAPVNVLPAL
jgi:hypothetical protein